MGQRGVFVNWSGEFNKNSTKIQRSMPLLFPGSDSVSDIFSDSVSVSDSDTVSDTV